ncbi:unnamed protein product [Arctia plantaginis]|uniref:Uncharacterized protein n=1 Tax=Arctia plantaginis TaxID=874455 RepID=A0A8S1B2P7_ARCPL|nr:unnamed protein product [Arctia plantaginis]
MYVAIVEAHVYTNKDVIFEDAAEFSETSSVQSAEEVNTAFEAMEAMQSENVLLESAVQQIEQANVVEETQDLSRVTAQSKATVQRIDEVVHESKSIQKEEYKKETAVQSTDVQEVVIQETKQVIEPVVEIKEMIKKENLSVDINESLYVAESSEINVHESKSEFTNIETKEESMAIIEEDNSESAVAQPIVEVKEDKQEIVNVKTEVESQVQIEDVTEKVVVKAEKPAITKEEEYAALKIVKEIETEEVASPEIIEVEEVEVNKIQMSKELQLDQSAILIEKSKISSELEMSKESQSKMTSEIDISTTSNHMSMESYRSENYMSESNVQESSFTAKSIDKKLTVRTDLKTQESIQSEPSTIDTPTPSTVPPTPLTDEYVFKLTIPLPKSRSTTPVPRDCSLSPKEEDPHIVKKKLIPHIETTINRIVYDPPLPTPPGECPLTPIFKTPGLFGGSSKPIYKIKFPMVYRKPGLFGGADNPQFDKEEIREIERKSSLLASAIDETIKSIEEYKEEVGIETKKKVKIAEFKEDTYTKSYQESYGEETFKEAKGNSFEESNTSIKEIVEKSETANDNTETSVAIEITEEETTEKMKTDIQNQSSENESVKEIDVNIEQETKPEEIIDERIEVKRTTNITEVKKNEIKNSEVSMESVNDSQNTVIESEKEVTEVKLVEEDNKKDPMTGFRPVVFDPESIQKRSVPHFLVQELPSQESRGSPYLTESGEIIGTVQGIVDGLEEPVMDPELAKELGKPGISEEKIAELISGEAEMLREAHVMG